MLSPVGGWDALTPFLNGWAGVDLFFVLSGFLITHHILKRWTLPLRWGQVRTYLAKRLLRIVPAYYGILLIVVLGLIPWYQLPPENLGWKLAYHLAFLQDYLPANIIVAFWSLGVEEKFYLTIPVVVLLLSHLRTVRERVFVLTALAFVPLLLRYMAWSAHPEIDTYGEYFRMLRSPFHLSLDSLLVGCTCAFLHQHRSEFPWLERAGIIRGLFWGGLGVSGYLLCAQPLLHSVSWFNVTLLYTLLGFSFGAVLLSLISGRAPGAAFFRARWLFFFSKISYSLYLVHMIFMGIVFIVLRDHLQLMSRPESTFSANERHIQLSANDGVLAYANVLDAMEKAEEAIQGLDTERFREARALFDRFYEEARKHAIEARDQQLLNQTFLLKHFMSELAAAGDTRLMHDHREARRRIQKEVEYRRYLMEHHRGHRGQQ